MNAGHGPAASSYSHKSDFGCHDLSGTGSPAEDCGTVKPYRVPGSPYPCWLLRPSGHPVADGPPNNSAAVQIKVDGKVEPTLCGPDAVYIAGPIAVRLCWPQSRHLAGSQTMVAVGGHLVLALANGLDAIDTYQPTNSAFALSELRLLAALGALHPAQLHRYTRTTITVEAQQKLLAVMRQHLHISPRSMLVGRPRQER